MGRCFELPWTLVENLGKSQLESERNSSVAIDRAHSIEFTKIKKKNVRSSMHRHISSRTVSHARAKLALQTVLGLVGADSWGLGSRLMVKSINS